MSVVVFRVDASIEIGSGHLMRCMALATALKKQGAKVYFIARHILHTQNNSIIQQEFTLHLLQTPTKQINPNDLYESWLGTDWKTDATDCINILKLLPRVELLIVDHYALDARWENAIRPYVNKLLVIDDIANRPHSCDILLDQNFYRNQEVRYQKLITAETVCLLGPKYALLRPEFQEARRLFPRLERPLQPVKRLNICLGGVDYKGESLKILKALSPWLNKNNLQVDLIISSVSPYLSSIMTFAKSYKAITVHISSTDIAEQLAKADIAIGAVGTMVWERACVGIPSITIAIADNQYQLGEDLSLAGIHLFAGKSEELSIESIRSTFLCLLNNPYLRQLLADNSLRLTDGQGILRLINLIYPPIIMFRKAELLDSEDLFIWRNHPINRQYSHHAHEISFEEHQAWLHKTLESNHSILLIASDKHGPLGVLRFDKKECDWRVSIYLVPGRHGHRLSITCLNQGLKWLRDHCKSNFIVTAEIYPDNMASILAFEQAGFKKQFYTFATEITS